MLNGEIGVSQVGLCGQSSKLTHASAQWQPCTTWGWTSSSSTKPSLVRLLTIWPCLSRTLVSTLTTLTLEENVGAADCCCCCCESDGRAAASSDKAHSYSLVPGCLTIDCLRNGRPLINSSHRERRFHKLQKPRRRASNANQVAWAGPSSKHGWR